MDRYIDYGDPKVVTMVVTLPPAPTCRMALAALALAFPFSLRMATWFPWTMTQAFALSLGMATWFPWTMTQAFALSLRFSCRLHVRNTCLIKHHPVTQSRMECPKDEEDPSTRSHGKSISRGKSSSGREAKITINVRCKVKSSSHPHKKTCYVSKFQGC